MEKQLNEVNEAEEYVVYRHTRKKIYNVERIGGKMIAKEVSRKDYNLLLGFSKKDEPESWRKPRCNDIKSTIATGSLSPRKDYGTFGRLYHIKTTRSGMPKVSNKKLIKKQQYSRIDKIMKEIEEQKAWQQHYFQNDPDIQTIQYPKPKKEKPIRRSSFGDLLRKALVK